MGCLELGSDRSAPRKRRRLNPQRSITLYRKRRRRCWLYTWPVDPWSCLAANPVSPLTMQPVAYRLLQNISGFFGTGGRSIVLCTQSRVAYRQCFPCVLHIAAVLCWQRDYGLFIMFCRMLCAIQRPKWKALRWYRLRWR